MCSQEGLGIMDIFLVLPTPFHYRRDQTDEISQTKPIKNVYMLSKFTILFMSNPGLTFILFILSQTNAKVKHECASFIAK